MIQNKINIFVSIAIFLLYNKMLLGHKNVKTVLEMLQDKNKSKQCECAMQKSDGRKALLLQRKGHLVWNMFNVIWVFSKRYASKAPTPILILVPYYRKSKLHFVIVALYLMFKYYSKRLSSLIH